MEAKEVAVVARDPVALGHLGRLAGDLGDALQLSGRGADADDGRDREAECARIELGAVAGNDARALQALDALGHGGRGEADAAAELRHRDAAV